jgi:hypothetical protein
MASTLRDGAITWSGERDAEGHRTYTLIWFAEAGRDDGPAVVMQTPGLYLPGAGYSVADDIDIWAWCRPELKVSPAPDTKEGSYTRFWRIEQKFSTRPPDTKRCAENDIQDPLLQPQKVNGSFAKATREATKDRFGNPIVSSSHEMLRGNSSEFDASRLTVTIEQNVALLELDLVSLMTDTVNDDVLWDFDARCVKLDNMSWEKKFYGSCYVYYTRKLEFSTNRATFDRDILDEGNKALRGHWNQSNIWELDKLGGQLPNVNNPADFVRVLDPQGQPMRVVLDGTGKPVNTQPTSYYVSLATRVVAGTGYHAGDKLHVTGGTFTEKCTIVVHTVNDGDGSINEYAVLVPGLYTAKPANAVATTALTGTGTGATFNLTWVTQAPTTPAYRHVEYYPESDFLLLGIPVTL